MDYFIHLSILVSSYAILGISLNLVVGYAGLLSLTQAAFYGIGAYATAVLLTTYDVNFFLSLIIGAIVSGFLALLIGHVLSRLKGDYYALGSLGFNIIVYSVLLNWQSLTRGPLGIPGIGRPSVFGFTFSENVSFLLLVAGSAALIFFTARFVADSSFGRVLKAIREDEQALQIFGYKTHRYKLAIFIIGAMMASISGSFFASYITFIAPSTFTVNESTFILSVIILGGLANLRGSVLGALFLILLPEVLRFVGFPSDIAAQMRVLVYGALLIILMMYRPQGLLGEYRL